MHWTGFGNLNSARRMMYKKHQREASVLPLGLHILIPTRKTYRELD